MNKQNIKKRKQKTLYYKYFRTNTVSFPVSGPRFCGHSPSTWSQWPSCPNFSWSARPARPRPSPPTTCSSWDSTEPFTSSTGYGGSTSRDSLTWSPSLPGWCRPSSTAISSICMLQKVRAAAFFCLFIYYTTELTSLVLFEYLTH